MSALDAYVSAPEAARRLRVDPSRIRVLADSGRLSATKKAGRWMIEASSVAQYERSARPPGRGLTAPNAWSVIALASGEPTPWLRASERYRMRLMLNRDGLTGLADRMLRRDRRTFWLAHPAALWRLREESDVSPAGVSAVGPAGIKLVAADQLDLRVTERRASQLAKEFALTPTTAGESNLSLRIVEDRIGWMISSRPSRATVAMDLATDFDARSRREGLAALRRIDGKKLWRPAR